MIFFFKIGDQSTGPRVTQSSAKVHETRREEPVFVDWIFMNLQQGFCGFMAVR